MKKRIVLIFTAAILFGAAAFAFALEGAGPADVYGGPSENTNYCTPYHFLAPGTEDEERYWFPDPNLMETDPDHFAYWTQGNNISRMITNHGVHNIISAWQQGALACIYPKGSAYKLIRSFSPFFFCTGEFNAREPKDTTNITFIGGTQHAGHIPTDLGYLQDGDRWNSKYTGDTEYLRVNVRPEDLEAWPEEFRDENGEPIVISDEDVVVIYTGLGYGAGYNWGAIRNKLTYGSYVWLEYQERVMSFSASIARDIQFNDITMINKSRFHTFQEIGPHDIEDIVAGPGGIFEMGDQLGGQKIAWNERLRFGFNYEETFSDPAMEGPTPLRPVRKRLGILLPTTRVYRFEIQDDQGRGEIPLPAGPGAQPGQPGRG